MEEGEALTKAILFDLGRKAYGPTLELQERCVAWRLAEKDRPDLLIMVEHNPVFTLGKNGGRESLMVAESVLAERGVELFQTGRGGDITWHGPGQLVLYPIVYLKKMGLGVAEYVALLEDLMIDLAAHFGVLCGRDPRNHGVWIGDNKLGSIGIRVRHGVTFHGLAFNVNPSLEHFSWINPCGLHHIGVTSLEKESEQPIDYCEVKSVAANLFAEKFNKKLIAQSPAEFFN